jgi:membrane-bound lytic murein transglycosylase B
MTSAPSASTAPSTTAAPTPTPTPTPAPAPAGVPGLAAVARVGEAAPNGLVMPQPASDAAGIAAQVNAAEGALGDPAVVDPVRATWARLQQVAYRRWSGHTDWDVTVRAALDPAVRARADQHLQARREFIDMRTTVSPTVPDWRVVAPEPADRLLAYYREAGAATGVPWSYLAAINLVESGFGRIHGLSVAGAQGPMQFLPTTWAERGIGAGSIDDPHDAIQAAARYLVRRGGPKDMAAALRGYNNHAAYVRAVTTYATMFAADERTYTALWNWEIFYFAEPGDLWLPVGYEQPVRLAATDYLRTAPWSAPAP